MRGIILVGGRGTRLRPLTFFRPKPLVPVVNKAFLEYQVELLHKHGINDIILCVNYQAQKLRSHFGDGSRWGVRIFYVNEDHPLGTAGAIKNAEPLVGGTTVVVLNGDILTEIDLGRVIRFHHDSGAKATLTLVEVPDPTSYGLVLVDKSSRVQRFLEKPSWDEAVTNTVNAGIYVLEPDIFRFIPSGREVSVERETYPELLSRGVPVYGYVTRDYWLDIGTPDKYMQSHRDIINHRVKVNVPGEEVQPGVWYGRGVTTSGSVRLRPPVVLGDWVEIGEDVSLGPNVVVGPGVRIEEGAALSNSVVQHNCTVGAHVVIKNCILDYGSQVWEDTALEGLMVGAHSSFAKGTKTSVNLQEA